MTGVLYGGVRKVWLRRNIIITTHLAHFQDEGH